jgi:hypothetical protein
MWTDSTLTGELAGITHRTIPEISLRRRLEWDRELRRLQIFQLEPFAWLLFHLLGSFSHQRLSSREALQVQLGQRR